MLLVAGSWFRSTPTAITLKMQSKEREMWAGEGWTGHMVIATRTKQQLGALVPGWVTIWRVLFFHE